ncbi:MAG TPA: ribosome small subunit-dependent GTPase A [Frankiaceae bacterium]|jgi:ribosome biogenesis GTPase|nr:ribosome small subunit-dependent GTPase A [Frankiaceae bacterium]
MPRSLDEDDVPIRPGGANRRRSRLRPEHADARDALITTVDRGRSTCRLLDSGTSVVAVRGADVRRTPVVVGDRVRLVGDVSGRDGSLARIVSVADRVSVLRRTPDDADPAERPIVANADQLIVVVALTSPPARPRMIDRLLVAAYDGGLTPVLCLTKHDLAGKLAPDDADRDALTTLTAAYEPLGVPVVTAGVDDSIDPIKAVLAGKMSVLFGHSGVGKSTLVNRLVPGAYRATGEVSDIGRGRHVSSSVIALELPGGGWVVDTPGVRSFGLGLVSPARVLSAFEDLAAVIEECPRGCTHLPGSPDCALDVYAATGAPQAARVDSLRRLLLSRESADD